MQAAPRLRVAELARRIGLSGPAAADRLRRLEESGTLSYRAEVSPRALGYTIRVIVRISPTGGGLRLIPGIAAEVPKHLPGRHLQRRGRAGRGTDAQLLDDDDQAGRSPAVRLRRDQPGDAIQLYNAHPQAVIGHMANYIYEYVFHDLPVSSATFEAGPGSARRSGGRSPPARATAATRSCWPG